MSMMLMESIADPRRANWLTITSMSEDLCWPEETNASRPNWELEAEILRLTTRLMMRERELRQVKNQLKTQTSKAHQQINVWKRRMEEKEEQMRMLLVKKDIEMQSIVSQLLMFEADLRQEQTRIEELLHEKDSHILKQRKEIERLERSIQNQKSSISDDDSSLPELINSDNNNVPHDQNDLTVNNSYNAMQKLKIGLVKIRAIQDVTNVRSRGDKTVDSYYENMLNGSKRVPCKAPQKMKDLKAKRINPHKTHRPVMAEVCGQTIL